jgi:hypothetical protein
MASDASDTKWSFLIIQEDGVVATQESGRFDEHHRDAKIFVKEMVAVHFGLKRVLQAFPQSSHIIAICDNTAVVRGLTKMCSTQEVEQLVREIHGMCTGIRLEMRWIESKGNVAHSATHDEDLDVARLQRTLNVAGVKRFE